MKTEKARRRLPWGTVLTYAAVAVFLLQILLPFLWMFISSVSEQRELLATPPHWIPDKITFYRYTSLLSRVVDGVALPAAASQFKHAFVNSLIIASTTTVVCLVFGTLGAYAFTRLPFPYKNHVLLGLLTTQMLPIIATVIPLFQLMRVLKLSDTHLGMVILYSGVLLSPALWMLRSYFMTIPKELEEAAYLDGASRIGTLVRVIVPLATPGLVAVGAYAFLSAWNEFFMALIFTSNVAKTVTVTVTEFTTQSGVDYGLMTTGGVIGSIPPLILVFLFQRYIADGLTAGAVK